MATGAMPLGWAVAWDGPRARRWAGLAAALALAGAACGVAAAGAVGPALHTALAREVGRYVAGWIHHGAAGDHGGLWRSAFLLQARSAALIWLGGLLTLGWLLAGAVVVAQGFAVGFTAATLVAAAPAPVAALTLAPAVLAVAVQAAAGATALALSWRRLLAARARAAHPSPATHAAYALVLVVALLVLGGVTLAQASAVPWALHRLM